MKWATAFNVLRAVARFTGSDMFCFVILGLRSQSLAEPQDRLIRACEPMKWATALIALRAVARFTGSDMFWFVILGLRSQSLAPPQALC
jgi:hypothetical protein